MNLLDAASKVGSAVSGLWSGLKSVGKSAAGAGPGEMPRLPAPGAATPVPEAPDDGDGGPIPPLTPPANAPPPDMRQVLVGQLQDEGIQSRPLSSVHMVGGPGGQAAAQPAAETEPPSQDSLPPLPHEAALQSAAQAIMAMPTPEERVAARAGRERDQRQQRMSGASYGADAFVPTGADMGGQGGGMPALHPPGGPDGTRGFASDIAGLIQVSSQMLEVLGEIHKTLQEILQKDTDSTFSE